jgi:hypothetical protein
MKKIAIVQSNYIPWKGYFDMIRNVDEFVIYDDVQYTRQDWRNRNRIKTSGGVEWLTVPVRMKGKFPQAIRETEIAGHDWASTHWRSLKQNYLRAPCFTQVAQWLEPIYLNETFTHLSALNRRLIEAICQFLEIRTKIAYSWDYRLSEGKSERLADLCVQAGGAEYISGPAAKSYLEEDIFIQRGVKVTWFDYDGYPEYPQLWGEFVHEVTVLDLLFNCGDQAPMFLKRARDDAG